MYSLRFVHLKTAAKVSCANVLTGENSAALQCAAGGLWPDFSEDVLAVGNTGRSGVMWVWRFVC